MTADEFRAIALSLPEAVEAEHMNHPDFRVGGKIFATLGPAPDRAMVKLRPEQQATFVESDPDCFSSSSGAWGRQGCTNLSLPAAQEIPIRHALSLAWSNSAPRRLLRESRGV